MIHGEKSTKPALGLRGKKAQNLAPAVFALVLDKKVRSGSKFGFTWSKFDGELESGFCSFGSGRRSALPLFSGLEISM